MISIITILKASQRLWLFIMALRLTQVVRQGRERVWAGGDNSHPRNQHKQSHGIMSPPGTVLRILRGTGLHLPFLSAGFFYSPLFYLQSEESSFVAVIAIIAFSLLRARQWFPIASCIGLNQIDHRLQPFPVPSSHPSPCPGFPLHSNPASCSWLCTLSPLPPPVEGGPPRREWTPT